MKKGAQSLKAKISAKCLSEEQLVEQIKKTAYELYEKKGCINGNETANWLEAEKMIKSQMSRDNR